MSDEKSHQDLKYFRLKVRLFFFVIFSLFLFFIIYRAIVPFGNITYIYNFESDSKFIGSLSPRERLGETSNGEQKIIADPVYFNLYTPRKFFTAQLELKYKNQSSSSRPLILETGLLADNILWRYNLQPVENEIIEKLKLDWNLVTKDNLILLQRNENFDNIDDFLIDSASSTIDFAKIAVYNYDFPVNFKIQDYQKSDKKNKLNLNLRESWEFFTYLEDEFLNFEFEFLDINANKDPDHIYLTVLQDGKEIFYEELLDNTYSENNKDSKILEHRKMTVNISEKMSGVFKVLLRANDDIITEKINTSQQKLAWINKIWLSHNFSHPQDRSPINIITNVSKLRLKTTWPENMGEFYINQEKKIIDKTYKQFNYDISHKEQGKSEIILSNNGYILAGDGIFAFDNDSFFDPRIKKLNQNLNLDSIDYVIADYKSPDKEGEYKKQTLEFDLLGAYREDKMYKFIISAPFINEKNYIKLNEIKIKLRGTNLYDKIKNSIF